MKTEERIRGPRLSAEQRRDEVLDAAVIEFAAYGLHGASTEAIAARAGISQPYIFRLFGTKKELFIAAAERVCDRINAAFREAVATEPEQPFHAMGQAYKGLLAHREEFLMFLQAFAAAEDREVREVMRRRFGDIFYRVEAVTKASAPEIQQFIAFGMLLMITTALDVPALVGQEDWAGKLLTEEQLEHDPCRWRE